MEIGSIFLILAILIPVVIFITRPLFERNPVPVAQQEQDISTLLAQRDQIVASVKELDDDYNLGKIPAEVYSPQRMILIQNGVEVLRQIDTLQNTSSTVNAEAQLEVVIATHRQEFDSAASPVRKNGNAVPPVPDDDLEQKIASRRREKQGKAGGFCPKCGKPVQATDRFCPKCGATLV